MNESIINLRLGESGLALSAVNLPFRKLGKNKY